jgi:hypothetical protein
MERYCRDSANALGWTCPAGLLAVTGLAVVAAIIAARTGEGPDGENCFKAQCKLSIQKEQAKAAQYSATAGFAHSRPAQIEDSVSDEVDR